MLSLFFALTVFAAARGDSSNRILGAEDAKEGEFPFAASLLITDTEKMYAGSILTKDWVLTSAISCQFGPERTIVHSGSIYINRGGTNRTVERIEKHDRAYRYAFDVCLIRVSKPFTFDDNVRPATLPKSNWTVEPGDVVTVAGWGMRTPSLEMSNALHKLDTLKIMDRDVCQKETWLKLYPGVNCIRSALRKEGVCRYDIGDPAVKDGVLIGHVSWYIAPCQNRVPAVITSVPFFLDWIVETLGPDAAELKYDDSILIYNA